MSLQAPDVALPPMEVTLRFDIAMALRLLRVPTLEFDAEPGETRMHSCTTKTIR
jgi:hypothetical protein